MNAKASRRDDKGISKGEGASDAEVRMESTVKSRARSESKTCTISISACI